MLKFFLKLRNKLNFHPKQIIHNFKTRNWNQVQQSYYWENKSKEQPIYKYDNNSNWFQIQQPLIYALGGIRKEKQDIRILEIGCNIGNNLKHLLEYGYTNLTGVEIKKEHIDQIPRQVEVLCGDITKMAISSEFDVIFSSAVLMHIEDLSFLINLRTKLFITFESESHKTEFIYKRNYKRVFEKIGYLERGSQRFVWNNAYVTRLFEKIEV